MNLDDARKRIESAVTQYGQHAAPAIDLVMAEVRSDMGPAHSTTWSTSSTWSYCITFPHGIGPFQ